MGPGAVKLMSENEHALIEAIRKGETREYGKIVEKYQGRIYATLVGILGQAEDARDLTQDVFIRAYRKLDRFQGQSSLYTWLYRIAVNAAIDVSRKRKKEKTVHANDDKGGLDVLLAHQERPKNTYSVSERREIRERVLEAMDSLPAHHRAVIIMREIEGYTYTEIAETLGIRTGTVMSRLHNARDKVRSILEKLEIR